MKTNIQSRKSEENKKGDKVILHEETHKERVM